MKKRTVITGMAFMVVTAALAQNAPPPPPPPKAPIEELKAMPPSSTQAPELPKAPLPPMPPEVTSEAAATLPDDQDFLKRNPSVSTVLWNANSVIITLKGGKQERYFLNESGIKQAEAKYGKLPVPPPPPPPPPTPPKRSKRTLS